MDLIYLVSLLKSGEIWLSLKRRRPEIMDLMARGNLTRRSISPEIIPIPCATCIRPSCCCYCTHHDTGRVCAGKLCPYREPSPLRDCPHPDWPGSHGCLNRSVPLGQAPLLFGTLLASLAIPFFQDSVWAFLLAEVIPIILVNHPFVFNDDWRAIFIDSKNIYTTTVSFSCPLFRTEKSNSKNGIQILFYYCLERFFKKHILTHYFHRNIFFNLKSLISLMVSQSLVSSIDEGIKK